MTCWSRREQEKNACRYLFERISAAAEVLSTGNVVFLALEFARRVFRFDQAWGWDRCGFV